MSQFWTSLVKELDPYVPGEQPKDPHLIKLNTNENPYGPSPRVLAVLRNTLTDALRLYPDPNAAELKATIAEYFQIDSKEVFVGNGSDEVLAHIFQGLLKHKDPLLFPDISYSFYPVYCGLYGIDYVRPALDETFNINVDDYAQKNGGIIFPNPNAPTGNALSLDDIEHLLQKNTHSVIVVDEAYIDFGGETAAPLIKKYNNLLVVQTLSKSRSLAGLRVGFAMGHADLIDGLERVKNSFNSYPLDRLAISGAIEAIKDDEYFNETRKKIISSRQYLTDELTQLGFDVLPSKANFVFARHQQKNASDLFKKLRDNNIIVRHFNHERISQFLRITVGTQAECETLVSTLKIIIAEE